MVHSEWKHRHRHTHTDTHTRTHARTHTHTLTHTAGTHRHVHAAHTHTHTHTHTQKTGLCSHVPCALAVLCGSYAQQVALHVELRRLWMPLLLKCQVIGSLAAAEP